MFLFHVSFHVSDNLGWNHIIIPECNWQLTEEYLLKIQVFIPMSAFWTWCKCRVFLSPLNTSCQNSHWFLTHFYFSNMLCIRPWITEYENMLVGILHFYEGHIYISQPLKHVRTQFDISTQQVVQINVVVFIFPETITIGHCKQTTYICLGHVSIMYYYLPTHTYQ